MERFKFISLTYLSILFIALHPIEAQNKKPFVIPELKEWTGAEGHFSPDDSRIVIEDMMCQTTAEEFAQDYQTMFGKKLKIVHKNPRPGDFIFRQNKDERLGEEGYEIEIGEQVILSASHETGLYWGTRTLLHISEQTSDQQMPCGHIVDFPDYPVRGFMIDCGRKFIPMSYLEDFMQIMSYYKMNTFQIHLNDNGFYEIYGQDWTQTYSAFRLESETYPGLSAADGHYTKKEFIDFQRLAEKHHVEIIPEIDSPAHSLAFAKYLPEIGSEEYGKDHLDLFNPKTYTFMDALWKEYLDGEEPVFRGPRVHIGTDEYSNKDQKVVEKFREYTDHYIRYIESFGKQACLWGALTHAKGTTPVKSENVIMSAWYNGYAKPTDMIEQGYQLISINDAFLYIVPQTGYYNDYLDTQFLYDSWTPAHIGNDVFEEKHPSILGGMFAVWNDHVGNGISVKDIHHRCYPALQTLATKTWSAKTPDLSFTEFEDKRKALSEAPGVNQMGLLSKTPGLIYEKERVKAGERLPYEEIGYDYKVSFDLTPAMEEKGTVLFESEQAKFYLADPVRGLMGYERDGYLNTFLYRVCPGEKVNVSIEGNSSSIRLFINGQLFENHDIQDLYYLDGRNQTKKLIRYVRTLVFPLRRTGHFHSKISHLKVEQK